MLVENKEHKFYLNALNSRIEQLSSAFTGRAALPEDNQHGLTRGHYPPEHMKNFKIVDKLALSLALADFSAILKQLNQFK